MRISIQANHRQETETNCRQEVETTLRQGSEFKKPRRKKKKCSNRNVGIPEVPREGHIGFKSVLTRPFSLWNEIEEIVGEFLAYLNKDQRSNIIKNLIRFLELKVIMKEYGTNGLLSPTEAVAHVWHVLILETKLYRDVVCSIQDFHGRPHRFIHHALLRKYNTKEYHERLKRTQRLFKSYYGAEMPTVLGMESDTRNNAVPRDLPKSVTIDTDTPSLVSASFDDFSFEHKKNFTPWYSNWLPSVPWFSAFENGLCGHGRNYVDICAQEEDVSLLTTPLGLSDE